MSRYRDHLLVSSKVTGIRDDGVLSVCVCVGVGVCVR